MRRRTTSLVLPFILLLGMGVAGADTVPERRVQDPARFEPPTVMELLEVPIPGPTTFPEEAAEEEDVEPADEDGEPNENASHGKLVSEAAQDDSFQGCEKGRHVSEIASSKSQGRGKGRDERPPCPAGGDEEGEGRGGPPPWAGGPPPWAGGPPPGAGPPGGP